MKSSIELKGAILSAAAGLMAVTAALTAGGMFQLRAAAAPGASEVVKTPPAGTLASQGSQLFLQNCAHCHGADARGDEGPDLHGVAKSDERLAKIIQNGIKGEMPKFSAKLNEADTKALIAYIRTLKD